MKTHRIAVDTSTRKGLPYTVNESNGRFYIYDVDVGILFDSKTKIGEAQNMEDALTIIKSHAGSAIRVRIK